MTYRISNQAGQLVTVALPTFVLIVTLLVFAFWGTIEAAEADQVSKQADMNKIELAYLGLNP